MRTALRSALPFIALFVATGAFCGTVLWLYDRYTYRRMLKHVHSIMQLAPGRALERTFDA